MQVTTSLQPDCEFDNAKIVATSGSKIFMSALFVNPTGIVSDDGIITWSVKYQTILGVK